MWIKGKVSEAKGQMILLPEQCTKLRSITSLLFYLELFCLLFFLSSLTYSSPPQSTENSSSRSSDSNSNWNTHKHSTALSAGVWRVLLQILGAFFFIFKVSNKPITVAESVPFRWIHRKWEEHGSGETSSSLSPLKHVACAIILSIMSNCYCVYLIKKTTFSLAFAFPGCLMKWFCFWWR